MCVCMCICAVAVHLLAHLLVYVYVYMYVCGSRTPAGSPPSGPSHIHIHIHIHIHSPPSGPSRRCRRTPRPRRCGPAASPACGIHVCVRVPMRPCDCTCVSCTYIYRHVYAHETHSYTCARDPRARARAHVQPRLRVVAALGVEAQVLPMEPRHL